MKSRPFRVIRGKSSALLRQGGINQSGESSRAGPKILGLFIVKKSYYEVATVFSSTVIFTQTGAKAGALHSMTKKQRQRAKEVVPGAETVKSAGTGEVRSGYIARLAGPPVLVDFEVLNGQAVFEGDIVLGRAEDFVG